MYSNQPNPICHVLTIGRKTPQVVRRIKINYVWALGYNILMLPLAAGAFYPLMQAQLPPWLAGGAMAFSSVSVVCSSLLLRCYRRPPPVLHDVS
jgi:Cu+-exporting ATPase